MIKMNDKGKDLNIYIANDLGFCGSFNSNIHEVLKQDKRKRQNYNWKKNNARK